MSKDTYCSFCGLKFKEVNYPKKCDCGNICWNNPISVIAVCYKIQIFKEVNGIIILKRNIEPCKDGWALPGGYIDYGETWQESAARELYEEVNVESSANDYELIGIEKSINNNLIIFANYIGKIKHFSEIKFVKNHEVQEIKFVCNSWEQELCFESHNKMLKSLI